MINRATSNLDAFCNEVAELKQGSDLLLEIWEAVGAYRDGKIPDELWYRVQNHFGFDDSE